MDVTQVLLDILVVLVAAKVAAEGAERIGIPAVVGEIVAGVLIGPSILGLVQGDEVLRVLGELGVILLLLDVGLEMDIGELTAVGRSALSVATLGVVVPMVGGMGAAMGLGMDVNEALFVGAALTATSVGITARVFGDLRMLATPEARTVLGAAVADDVMGLVILTVVTRVASQGSVSLATVAGVILVALGFLVVATVAGVKLVPLLFGHLTRISRSPGTLIAISLAFTLAMAELANAAKLAPIVGAFVAGLSLSRADAAPRIRRELTPVGHLLIPVFFLQIGIDAEIGQLAKPRVLAIAAVLIVVAVAGKLVSALGASAGSGDRLLVGLAMVPRGEVGLIFATLGLAQGILGADLYASVLLVVLVTTLMTPSLLTWRARSLSGETAARADADEAQSVEPVTGWLTTGEAGGPVDLAATPPTDRAVELSLSAALALSAGHHAGDRLVAWLGRLPDEPLTWDDAARRQLRSVLARGDARAWRFLLVTGVLDRALPELAQSLRLRLEDPFEPDPTRSMSWPRLTDVNELDLDRARSPELVRLAALLLDACDADPDLEAANQLVEPVSRRIGLDEQSQAELGMLVRAATLLPAAAHRIDGLDEEPVLQLASHLGSSEIADMAWMVASTTPNDHRDADRLDALRALVLGALSQAEGSGPSPEGLERERRSEASAIAPDAASRITATPRTFVLSQTASDLARQAALASPPIPKGAVRAAVTPAGEPGQWRVDIALADRIGLLARQLAALRDLDLRVLDVATVVWPDHQSLSTFRVEGGQQPSSDRVADVVASAMLAPPSVPPLPGAELHIDDDSSPWHTIVTVVNDDRSETLLAVANAVAQCELNVIAARTADDGDRHRVVLELTDRRGNRPTPAQLSPIADVLGRGGRPPGRRRSARHREP